MDQNENHHHHRTLDLLLRCIVAAFDASQPVSRSDAMEYWEEAAEIAAHLRVLPEFAKGVRNSLESGAQARLGELEKGFKFHCILHNGRLLPNAIELHRLLSETRISHVFLKGPFQQQQIYSSHFVRPSSDIDLYVARKDFARVADLLRMKGYSARHGLALWWTFFVGQDHWVHDTASDLSIDLHHRVQEPGCQQPIMMDNILTSPDSIMVGTTGLPVVRRDLLPLVLTANFVKGLARRRNSSVHLGHKMIAVHLLDLFKLLQRGNPVAIESYISLARRYRMEGSARLVIRCFNSVFGTAMPNLDRENASVLAAVDDATIQRIVFSPGSVEHWPRPSQVLRATWKGEPLEYLRDLGWYLSSEATRKLTRGHRMISGEL